jgi:hypothetical protein
MQLHTIHYSAFTTARPPQQGDGGAAHVERRFDQQRRRREGNQRVTTTREVGAILFAYVVNRYWRLSLPPVTHSLVLYLFIILSSCYVNREAGVAVYELVRTEQAEQQRRVKTNSELRQKVHAEERERRQRLTALIEAVESDGDGEEDRLNKRPEFQKLKRQQLLKAQNNAADAMHEYRAKLHRKKARQRQQAKCKVKVALATLCDKVGGASALETFIGVLCLLRTQISHNQYITSHNNRTTATSTRRMWRMDSSTKTTTTSPRSRSWWR